MENYQDIYSSEQINKINNEFSRLKDHCYLDHTGATLYSDVQISEVHKNLLKNVYGNPHAYNISSKFTGDAVDQMRFELIHFFNTKPEEYSLIFVSNATAALKIVAENFVYQKNGLDAGTFVYLEDNHTSVIGMREFAPKHEILPHSEAFEILNKKYENKKTNFESNSLFGYPAQCNFSGTKYPLSWIESVQNGALNGALNNVPSSNWYCVLDAASFAPSSKLDLNLYKPDFVCVSFYKIFGYPTGVGALLVKNSSAHLLEKKYFGGGTVQITLPKEHVFRETLHKRFEDGTVAFLSIIALRQGLETHRRLNLTMDLISKHVFNLAKYVYRELSSMHHSNEKPVAILYHDTSFEDVTHQGGIVNFNLFRDNGDFVGYSEVLQMANLYKIHMRTGCLCNPGACRRLLNLSEEDVQKQYEAGHVCGDQNDLIDGYPTGSCRISFGYMTTKENADKFLEMIKECFVTQPIIYKRPSNLTKCQIDYTKKFKNQNYSNGNKTELIKIVEYKNNGTNTPFLPEEKMRDDLEAQTGTLRNVFIYPIKSCGAFPVKQSWPVDVKGLRYDREWMIITNNGVCFTQKIEPKLCLIKPVLDVERGILELNYDGMESISVPLNLPEKQKLSEITYCHSKVCGDRVKCYDYGDVVAGWLNDCFYRSDLRLIRQLPDSNSRVNHKGESTDLALVNQGQYLLITTATVRLLAENIPNFEINDQNIEELISRFRANFIIDIESPTVENECQMIKIGNLPFLCTGPCTRCQMICIDQQTGSKTVEPLRTLFSFMKGRTRFGTYLNNVDTNKTSVRLGEKVVFYK